MVARAKLKFDQITVRGNGKGGADGKGSTVDFVSGLVRSFRPLYEITQYASVELPDFLGKPTGGKGAVAEPKQSAPKSGAKPEAGAGDAGD